MSMTYGRNPEAYLDEFRVVSSATPTLVRQSGEKWLKAHSYTLLVKPFGTVKPEISAVDRSLLPPLQSPASVDFPKVQTATLKNGLKVVLIERHTAPLLEISLVSNAGFSTDPQGKAGLSSLATRMMQEGTTTRDGFRLAEELESLGATLNTTSSLDLSTVRLAALKTRFVPALALLTDVLLRPAFAPEMLEIARRQQLARIDQEKVTPASMALRIVPRLLYSPGHAYANPLTGSGYNASVSSIVRDDLVAWHKRWIRPNNSTLIATGDITMAQLVEQASRAFDSWERSEVPSAPVSAVAGPGQTRVYLIDKPGATQSVIVAAHLTHPSGQPDELAIETVMQLFGGMSTSRLNRNLRLDKHWSYGVTGLLIDARGQRPFLVVAPVQTDKTKESMVEVTREIDAIAGRKPIQGEEFQNIRTKMSLGMAGRFASLSSLGRAAVNITSYGYPEEYYAKFVKNVDGLTEGTLASAAARFLTPGKLTWVVVGDLARIEKGVRELNYGEVIRLDAEGNPVP